MEYETIHISGEDVLAVDEYGEQTVADILAERRKYLTEEYEREIAAIEKFARQNPELLFKKRKEFEVLRYIL